MRWKSRSNVSAEMCFSLGKRSRRGGPNESMVLYATVKQVFYRILDLVTIYDTPKEAYNLIFVTGGSSFACQQGYTQKAFLGAASLQVVILLVYMIDHTNTQYNYNVHAAYSPARRRIISPPDHAGIMPSSQQIVSSPGISYALCSPWFSPGQANSQYMQQFNRYVRSSPLRHSSRYRHPFSHWLQYSSAPRVRREFYSTTPK